ncbi:MAG: hypothetical protein EBV03_11390 [Proteobacteria bacterium]|nr:hypothetical protein [Pseudomonadota bacterium]
MNLEGNGEISMRRLIKESLRMRPSRLIIGEIREAESLDLLIALNSGLPGMATIHANSARDAIRKLQTLPLLAGENISHHFVTPLVAIAAADCRVGMLCSKIFFHDAPDVIWFAGAHLRPLLGWNHHLGYGQVDDGRYDNVVETDRPTGCAMMVSKQVCKAIGLLREEMFCYAEDVDWGLRARNAGYKVVYVPTSKVWHKVTRSTGGVASPLSQYYSLRNMLLCLDLNLPLVFPLRVFRYVTVIGPYMTSALKLPGPRFRRLLAVIKGASHYFLGRFGPLDGPAL